MARLLGLKVSGQQKIVKGLDKLVKKLKDPRPANLAAVAEYRKWILNNFKAEGGNHEKGNLKWKPLKPATLRARREGKKKNRKDKILWDEGKLAQNWTETATKRFGKIRSKVEYSSAHENGVRSRNIPRRKIFPTVKQGSKIVIPVYEAFVKKLVKF